MEVHSFKLRATFIPISFENFPIVKLSSGNTEVLRETNSQPGGGVLAHFIHNSYSETRSTNMCDAGYRTIFWQQIISKQDNYPSSLHNGVAIICAVSLLMPEIILAFKIWLCQSESSICKFMQNNLRRFDAAEKLALQYLLLKRSSRTGFSQ